MSNTTPKPVPEQDPYATREAEKYDNPVPSREFITMLLEEKGKPMSFKAVSRAFEIDDEDQLEGLRRRLRAMERDGQLHFNRRGGYGLLSKMNLVRGRVIGHADGFGFLVPDEGDKDIFLSAKVMHNCLHGDRVVAHITGVDRRGRSEGAITEILEHANHHISGRFHIDGEIGFFEADNKRISQDILIPESERGNAEDGQLVVVEITEYPTKHHQAQGRIIEVLGDHMAPGMEIDMALRSHDIPYNWSPSVDEENAQLSDEVSEEDATQEGRVDLRDMPLVTIDGDDSMDFDDAVYAEKSGDGWRLVVAIADVSHYVAQGTALDAEARERGNSVYFPGRVVPMLPEKISNGLCSLNPKVDRLCMVCDMQVTADGLLDSHSFYPAVMNSHARLTYNDVAAILVEQDAKTTKKHAAVLPHLEDLYALFKALHKSREKRGAMDFDTTETKFVFASNKKIDRIVPVHRNDAHKLIEECMLLANTATADFLNKANIPTLYRVHAAPKEAKLESLREFLSEIGLKLNGGDKPSAKDYGDLLEQVREREDFHLIQTVMLRSMSQATYTPDNQGHFGLAFDAYAHFTSPIRRYPDLLVHRAIRHLTSGNEAITFKYGVQDMVQLGEHCSMTERRADDATRDTEDWLKCEYMLDRVGDEFHGVITSVTGFGLFVELTDIYVEGLVHITALKNDYYQFDAAKHRLLGERTNKIYRLSDPIDVRLVRVDLDDKKIDFELVLDEADEMPKKKKKRRTKRK